MMLFIEKWS